MSTPIESAPAHSGKSPKRLPVQMAWTLTEAANEPFFALVRTYVFSAYFVSVVAPGPSGNAAWGFIQAAGSILVALLAPTLGAFADAAGPRKPWIAGFALLAIIACASLWFAHPSASLWLVSLAVLAATVAIEIMLVFTNACLSWVAGPRRAGLLSGITFGIGQLVDILALLLILYLGSHPPARLADIPNAVDRASGPIAAVAVSIFLLPLLLLMPDEPRRATSRALLAREGLNTLWRTLRAAAKDRNMRLFMLGRAFGQDGMITLFAFSGILAVDAFGWKADDLAQFGIIVTACAALGGFAGGLVDARLGSRSALVGGLAMIAIGAVGILSTDSSRLLLITTETIAQATFQSPQEIAFIASAMIIALGAGPVHGAMRSLMARIAPLDQMTAYFGVYSLIGKATNFLGPLVVGTTAALIGSLRLGLCCTLIFLAIGAWCFFQVSERRIDP